MSTLEAERTHAANLDVQIQTLLRSVSSLLEQRRLVQERLDTYKYPVLTLPTEIICEIFTQLMPVYPACPPLDGVLSAANLTQICRTWRDVALATPALWRAVHMPFRPDTPFAHKLDLWLNKSSSPLSLEIEESSRSLHRTFAFSSGQCARWEYLKLRLAYGHLVTFDSLPLLGHLDVAFREARPSQLISFPAAPLLRSAVLNDRAARTLLLPWAQLTSLTLLNLFPDECVPVLQQTPNLTHCKLSLVGRMQPSSLWPDVTLSRLESLTLDLFTKPFRIAGYLETLIAPALRELQIEEQLLPDPIVSLASFIPKSGCPLREIGVLGTRTVSQDAYRRTFPLIGFSFDGRYIGKGADSADDAGRFEQQS
ncbi:hypothetical protein C8R46DRAFT_1067532 [Mycena filopes]|nr:hypothetical protein C8R46DRAFT_1067532 [Mycena filopes]